ncbi:FAD-dependent monooxygenase [Amycolatopsis sp. Poz14]|nr:FAD-dependent monooxygenase [Amycolatopsis sp. Poz14]
MGSTGMDVEYDVVIVGGGPVGLMLASELGLRPGRVLVLERLAEPSGQSRALGLHSRTVEVFDQRGLLPRFSEGAPVWPKGHFAGMRLLDLSKLNGRHTYALMVPQSRTEAILEERARELDVEIRRGHRLTELENGPDAVVATVTGPDGEYRIRSRYLVGCDGGSSLVRKLAGIDFPGTASNIDAMLADVHLDQVPDGPHLARCKGGVFGTVPLGGDLYRVVSVEFRPPTAHRDDPVELEELAASVKRVTDQELPMRDPVWLSRFGDATRQAAQYRKGRVMLAGDAAHVHFPAGGQGLNTGIQDVVNLGWKLAAVVNGSPDELLDTYHDERHPVGARVCFNTQAQLALMDPRPEIGPLRELFGTLMEFDEVNRYLAEMITALDVRYPTFPASDHPLAGTRVPEWSIVADGAATTTMKLLHSGRGVLVDLTDGPAVARTAAPWLDRLDLVSGTPCTSDVPAAFLLRPDGHVAWLAESPDTDPADLREALRAWFGPAPVRSLPAAAS